jgi:phage repressor protein C with HTH and peptisase S24 domain
MTDKPNSKLPVDAAGFAAWMKAKRETLAWSTTVLADRARALAHAEGNMIALTQQTISGFEQGEAKRVPQWMRYVREAFDSVDKHASVAKSSTSRPPEPDLPLTRAADSGEMVEIIKLDLSLPMGPGATVDDYIEEEPVSFDLGYVRGFTRTPPHRLRIARGVGDSMFPTLNSNDLVWIDSTQIYLNQQDRVWAVSINGAAAIKRLRSLKDGRVLVISDNPTIDNYEVGGDEIRIGGRVIRFARDL